MIFFMEQKTDYIGFAGYQQIVNGMTQLYDQVVWDDGTEKKRYTIMNDSIEFLPVEYHARLGQRIYRRMAVAHQGDIDHTTPTPKVTEGSAEPDFVPKNLVAMESGSLREDKRGKGRFDLLPYEGMLAAARRFEMGAKGHGDRNWEKGQPLSLLLSCMRRHAMQTGQDFSEDHVGAVLWNAMAFCAMVERIRSGALPKTLDDMNYLDNESKSKA